jgi:hypothetical protein
VIAHAQKPDFVFRQYWRVHLNRPGGGGKGGVSSVDYWQASCAHQPAGFVLLVLACVLQLRDAYWLPTPFSCYPLHFSSRASPCAITFQLEYTTAVQCSRVSGKILYLKSWCNHFMGVNRWQVRIARTLWEVLKGYYCRSTQGKEVRCSSEFAAGCTENIVITRHQSGLDRPVSVSSICLFKGLPSHLRPFAAQFSIIFAIVQLFVHATCRSQFYLYLLSFSSTGSTFRSFKIPLYLLWSKRCKRLFCWKKKLSRLKSMDFYPFV